MYSENQEARDKIDAPTPARQDYLTNEQTKQFHAFWDTIGYRSQYMVQDDFFMAWPRDKAMHDKMGTICMSTESALKLVAARTPAETTRDLPGDLWEMVSVNDALPTESGNYYCRVEGHGARLRMIMFFNKDGRWVSPGTHVENYGVTHWLRALAAGRSPVTPPPEELWNAAMGVVSLIAQEGVIPQMSDYSHYAALERLRNALKTSSLAYPAPPQGQTPAKCTCGFGRVGDFHWPGCPLKDVPSLNFATVADKDRHYICEIGRLFWGNDKQCYAADAVFEKVREAVMPRGRPPNTIICLVGSTKFTREMMIRSWELSKQNCIVLGWNVLPHDMCADSHGAEAEGVKEQIDELHKRKIDMCDEVQVINISGYIGESTRSEIEYALDLRKRVKFLFAAPIMCRKEIGPAIHPRLGLGSPLCGRMQGHNGKCNPVIPVGMEYAPTPVDGQR